MNKLFLYNTLTRKKEEFKPISKEVGLYTCGPTVYNYAHIGNLRTYIFEDLLKRTLIYNGYKVKHVMNITDVGHLTGDGDMGEDKLEKQFTNMLYIKCSNCKEKIPTFFAATKEAFKTGNFINNYVDCIKCKHENIFNKEDMFFESNKKSTIWEIADFYIKAFKDDLNKLNIIEPDKWTKATDYISEQIELIKILETKGYTYRTSDGIYFDTSKFKDYNKLSHLDLETLKEGARVEKNEEKKNPTDFALWKFTPVGTKRQMEWESPWGVGFPGWHLECSAMSMKELPDNQDIHCGGIDHINIHHTNEIAQSEAATGKKFFNFWMHGAFLNIAGGKKMAKSDDNFLTLENAFIKKDINPLVYRFATLQTHYRKPMEYSEEVMKNAEKGFKHLLNQIRELRSKNGKINIEFKKKFLNAVNDDLNIPKSLAIVQEVLKSDLSNEDKLTTVLDFDNVLGLNLSKPFYKITVMNVETGVHKISCGDVYMNSFPIDAPDLIKKMIDERTQAKREKNYVESDRLRDEIEKLGYTVEDTTGGMRVFKK